LHRQAANASDRHAAALTTLQAFTKPMPVASYEPAATVVCMATAARFLPGDLSDGLVSASS
jgi:hypothetical protein